MRSRVHPPCRDIYQRVKSLAYKHRLQVEPLGGGRIEHHSTQVRRAVRLAIGAGKGQDRGVGRPAPPAGVA